MSETERVSICLLFTHTVTETDTHTCALFLYISVIVWQFKVYGIQCTEEFTVQRFCLCELILFFSVTRFKFIWKFFDFQKVFNKKFRYFDSSEYKHRVSEQEVLSVHSLCYWNWHSNLCSIFISYCNLFTVHSLLLQCTVHNF